MNALSLDIPSVIHCLIVALIPIIIIFPVWRYIRAGSHLKEQEILDCQSETAAGLYFDMFCKGREREEGTNADRLRAFYSRWYGPIWFIQPTILAFVVALIGGYVETASVLSSLCNRESCDVFAVRGFPEAVRLPVAVSLPLPAMTALAGSLVWVTNDFITRARRLDFSPSDVHWGTLRVAASIPVGYGFVYLFIAAVPGGDKASSPVFASFVAFAIAAFPLQQAQRFVRRVFLAQSKFFKVKDETDEVMKLQGVNNEISSRLAQEDITTITQMAYCDPIRITMRSGLAFNFITDCMSQALAWQYLEDGMNVIRRLGYRGAVELSHFYDSLVQRRLSGSNIFEDSILASLCAALNANTKVAIYTPETFLFLLKELADDAFTKYLVSVSQPESKAAPAPARAN